MVQLLLYYKGDWENEVIKGPKRHKWQQGLKEEEIGGELLVKKMGPQGSHSFI